ncbi:MAG: hypothetical protein J6K43_16490 [Lachnospiraceae bacterium]|nr:hypothetical protein [Lachnospiraceae bacterium]
MALENNQVVLSSWSVTVGSMELETDGQGVGFINEIPIAPLSVSPAPILVPME